MTTSEPNRLQASSPIRPLLRLTIRIRPSSITDRRSTSPLGCPTIDRMSGFDRNWPILFWIGAIASALNFGGHGPNSVSQNARTTGSVTCVRSRCRNGLSVSSRINECVSHPHIAFRAASSVGFLDGATLYECEVRFG